MFENLSSAIKNEQHRLQSTFNLLKLSSNDIFLSLKNKKLDSYEIRSHEELQEQFCDLQNDPSDA